MSACEVGSENEQQEGGRRQRKKRRNIAAETLWALDADVELGTLINRKKRQIGLGQNQ
jgi:hypothetical protein